MQPTTMTQTARLRARDEKDSVAWVNLVPGYTVYGRPGYWRMVDTSVPVGQKAGGFVKSPAIKFHLDALYTRTGKWSLNRKGLALVLASENFHKETVR